MKLKKAHSTSFSGDTVLGKPQPEPEGPFTVSTWARIPYRRLPKRIRRRRARLYRRAMRKWQDTLKRGYFLTPNLPVRYVNIQLEIAQGEGT